MINRAKKAWKARRRQIQKQKWGILSLPKRVDGLWPKRFTRRDRAWLARTERYQSRVPERAAYFLYWHPKNPWRTV